MYGQHIHKNNVCKTCNWPLNLIDVALHWISRVSKVGVGMFLAIACKPNSTWFDGSITIRTMLREQAKPFLLQLWTKQTRSWVLTC
jgi:hypothetical protein